MSAPSAPPDRSVELRQLELDAEARRREEERLAAEAREAELAQLRADAYDLGRGNVTSYFAGQGLNPDDYASTIESELSNILLGISRDDPNPGSYFANAGASIFDTAEDRYRTEQQRALDSVFAPNFDRSRIADTTDDPYLAGIQAEQRQDADEIIRNMLNRGVITQSGYNAARNDLDSQVPLVNARLNEIGSGQLATGRQSLRDVANEARSSASQLRLGQQFDPFSYGGQADQVFNDFLSNLGGNIRAALPGPLFNTGNLAAVAGAGQGAQNTNFDPNALSGNTTNDDDDEEDRTGDNVIF